jgi:hypothetical protein
MKSLIKNRAVGLVLASALAVGGTVGLATAAGAADGPAAPLAASAVAGNHTLTVSWTPPSDT